jgi:hypothetical protein
MTRIRRGLLLLALVAGIVAAGSAGPALASFQATAPVSLGTVTTATVAVPGSVVGKVTCTSPKATMSVTWQRSTAPRVSGYRITVYYSDGFVQTAPATATATSWSVQTDLYNVTAYSVRFSVTTLTDYGWTAESPLTVSYTC